jgi:hypothetical protein
VMGLGKCRTPLVRQFCKELGTCKKRERMDFLLQNFYEKVS